MSAGYELSYTVSMDQLVRAMKSLSRPQKSGRTQLRETLVGVLCGAAIGALAAVLGIVDLISADALIGTALGAAAGLALWFVTYRRDFRRISGFVAEALEQQGRINALFAPHTVELRSDLGQAAYSWCAFHEVIEMPDATALRSGGVVHTVPDSALPPGVPPEDFRADLTRWMEASS